jgi:hypothetical protein
MPDPNKFQALRDAGFKIVPTCSTCICFRRGYRAAWGHCSAISHEHAKHGERPKTGVPNNGWCPKFELSREDLEDHVDSYVEFYDGPEEVTDG